jgi:hypothetical protein
MAAYTEIDTMDRTLSSAIRPNPRPWQTLECFLIDIEQPVPAGVTQKV